MMIERLQNILIRLLVGCMIMICWLQMPAPFRIGSLMTLSFLLYHWRVYHAPFVRLVMDALEEDQIR